MKAADGDLTICLQSPCNNCGSHDSRIIYPAGRAQVNQIVQCRACGLMFANRLSFANIEKYFKTEHSSSPLTEFSPEIKRSHNKLPDYEKIEGVLRELLPGTGTVLEVGAYCGILLNSFRQAGWSVSGIEPDARAVTYARTRYQLDIFRGTLQDSPLKDGSIDAVLMLHVIEHIDDPAAAVASVERVLRSGGIFVVETPCYDTLMYRLLGRRERSLSCNGHIFFYTEKTLSDLLQQNSFEIVKTERVGRTMSIARLLWNVGVMSKSSAIQRLLQSVSDKLGLERRFLYLNARDMIRIYARKR